MSRKWSPEEEEYLRQNYKTKKLPEMCADLGRTRESVIGKLNKMELVITKRRKKWNGCEDTPKNWKLSEIAELNIEKLKARYPDGFDVEHSLHRKEGDI